MNGQEKQTSISVLVRLFWRELLQNTHYLAFLTKEDVILHSSRMELGERFQAVGDHDMLDDLWPENKENIKGCQKALYADKNIVNAQSADIYSLS